jgi:hypothetical protein
LCVGRIYRLLNITVEWIERYGENKYTDKRKGDSGERREGNKGKKGTETEEDWNCFKVERGEGTGKK